MDPGTPHRTPHRTPQRHTPTRTPTRRSIFATSPMSRPTPPDFASIALELQQRQQLQQRTVLGKRNDDRFISYNPEKEPIKAYLRLRPCPAHYAIEEPYLQVVDNIEVSMTPPEDSNAYRTRNRAPERYKFTRIFTDSVAQKEFFSQTTLPLVEDALKGENALVFAYGVTNSGKTYTVMGTKDEAGLLPRTLDVIFNSVRGYLSEAKLKPTMHSLVQPYDDPAEENRDILEQIKNGETFSSKAMLMDISPPAVPDETVININEKYEYGIWLSFAEIYTEKIYDLLVQPDKQLKRRQLPLKYEYRSGHKYIAGLKQVKVQTIEEAYALMHESQRNRAVYSTLMNHTSSRSHSIFTINIIRSPIDDENYVIDDPSYATVSRISIVDLAGSERYRNTFNSGQRLKEAGNINKSLMVLGQCMETLRLNQIKAEIGKRQAIVPFRHSKLTELFKSSFEGDGKAVMVVNVNPFDTGFDENSHVMKFAAVAKNVATWRRVHPKIDLQNIPGSAKRLRTNTGMAQKQRHHSLMDLDNLTLDEMDIPVLSDDEDEDDEDQDPFVDNLISQLEDLRSKWVDAETRCATIESNVRRQVSKEMEAELQKMEDIYMSALKCKNDANEHQLQERMEYMGDDMGDPTHNRIWTDLRERQQHLTVEIDHLREIMRDHETTKNSLLEKIAELESEKRAEQEMNRQLSQQLREQGKEYKAKAEPMDEAEDASQPSTESELKKIADPKYEELLELRKRLRRSVFKSGDEYSPDTGEIMKEAEDFDGVTFELVKETNMGRLLKLIAQKKFEQDPQNIQERAKNLFKRFARLSIDILAPPPPPPHPAASVITTKQYRRKTHSRQQYGRTVHVSVDAGKEEDLISDMRIALETLQHENMKLKSRVKAMNDGHRRLKEAFEKTKDIGNDVPISLGTSPRQQDVRVLSAVQNEPSSPAPKVISEMERGVVTQQSRASSSSEFSTSMEQRPSLVVHSDDEQNDSEGVLLGSQDEEIPSPRRRRRTERIKQ